mmetsp:Transcript_18673/g.60371  ORF Transcript_18673/g.60371 Transcript_18673/m.60371 type:complete len:322 (+) Transcript_18673:223-1188(+)
MSSRRARAQREAAAEDKALLPVVVAMAFLAACLPLHSVHWSSSWSSEAVSSRKKKKTLEVVGGEVVYLILVFDDVLEALLGELPLEDALLEGPRGDEAVGVALELLAVAPAPGGGLFVVGGIPRHVEHDEPRAADEVQPAAPGLGAQEKGEVARLGVVEFVVELLPLLRRRRPAQLARGPPLRVAEALDQVEGRHEHRDHHDPLLPGLVELLHQRVEHPHLPGEPRVHHRLRGSRRVPREDPPVPALGLRRRLGVLRRRRRLGGNHRSQRGVPRRLLPLGRGRAPGDDDRGVVADLLEELDVAEGIFHGALQSGVAGALVD